MKLLPSAGHLSDAPRLAGEPLAEEVHDAMLTIRCRGAGSVASSSIYWKRGAFAAQDPMSGLGARAAGAHPVCRGPAGERQGAARAR